MTRSIAPALAALAMGVAALALPNAASAGSATYTYSTDGATTGTGPYTLTSTDSTYSILRFINDQAFTFGDLDSLSLDYNAIQGGVGGGAPRIAVVLDEDGDNSADSSFLILLGPPGSFVDGSLGPHSSGNLLTQNDTGRYDLSGLGGSAYTNYDAALAAAGSFNVLRFSLILDSYGGADKTISVGAHGLTAASDAIPEPATWAMMIAGFGLTGATLRRRKTASVRA
jgi:hypothetical protein